MLVSYYLTPFRLAELQKLFVSNNDEARGEAVTRFAKKIHGHSIYSNRENNVVY